MNENIEAFIVHISSLSLRLWMTIHPIRKAEIALLLDKKVTVLAKYFNFADVFLEESTNVLLKQNGVNKYITKLKQGKQSLYRLIYSLRPVKFKIVKTYIKINLANGFIKASKLPADAPILFVCKLNGSFSLGVNYQMFKNLTIKKRYLLLLIKDYLNWLDWAKQFIQLNFTSIYYQIRIKEGNKLKTIFLTQCSHFESQIMFFVLFNVAASFHDYINNILAKKLNIIVIIYLNDILIYTKDLC